MRIDRKLNLVLPLETDGGTIYVHSMPLSREAFERYYRIISKTFAAIYQEGLASIAGPRVAGMMLRDIATRSGVWDGPEGVENGLMNEIRRLSNVVMLGETGWVTVPFYDAIRRDLLTADDISEAEGAIVFFICNSAMHRRAVLGPILDGMASLWGAQIVSSNCTEFAASLPISTETASSGATVPISSVPS